MGGSTDALKVASSLTLFRAAASRQGAHGAGREQVEPFGQLHAAFAHRRAGDAVPAGDVGHRAAEVGKAGGEREAPS